MLLAVRLRTLASAWVLSHPGYQNVHILFLGAPVVRVEVLDRPDQGSPCKLVGSRSPSGVRELRDCAVVRAASLGSRAWPATPARASREGSGCTSGLSASRVVGHRPRGSRAIHTNRGPTPAQSTQTTGEPSFCGATALAPECAKPIPSRRSGGGSGYPPRPRPCPYDCACSPGRGPGSRSPA